MNPIQIAMTTAGLILGASGAAIWSAPIGAPSPNSIAPRTAVDPVALETMIELEKIERSFNLESAPKPLPPPPPPPDPAAMLRPYRFLGVASGDGRTRALFDRAGVVTILATGQTLEGRALLRADASGAVFAIEGGEFSLPMSP